jgi:hypothetical protein
MDQEIDQERIGRDRGKRDPQSRLRPVDRAHEAADRQEPQRRRDAPRQAQQIALRETRGRGRLAEHHQDLFAVQRKHHHRQGNQQRGPQADAKRAPHHARVAGAEGLRGKRRHRGHQSHPEGEADEEHRVRQRRGGNRLVAEASDQGKIGRHHRDLPELRQCDRDSQPERFDQLDGEMIAGGCRRDRSALDLVRGDHGMTLDHGVGNATGSRECGLDDKTPRARHRPLRRQVFERLAVGAAGRAPLPVLRRRIITHPHWR